MEAKINQLPFLLKNIFTVVLLTNTAILTLQSEF